MISNQVAQEIVSNINKITNTDINFFDLKGVIIASTDQKRMGEIHQGSLKAIEKKKTYIIERENSLEGKVGVNTPIYLYNKIIGVLGITGNPKEVSEIGEVASLVTEAFVKNIYIESLESSQKEHNKLVIEMLLFSTTYNSINSLSGISDEEISKGYRFAVISSKNSVSSLSDISYTIFEALKKKAIIAQIGFNFIILFPNESTNIEMLNETVNIINSKSHVKYSCGIGSIYYSIEQLKRSYLEAIQSLNWCTNEKSVLLYDDIVLAQLINSIDSKIFNSLDENVFSKISSEDFEILEYYFDNNCSLSKTSTNFFIHKNTLQNKLVRFQAQTGFDPREFKDAYVIYTYIKRSLK